jgi:hypothetical protein
MIHFESIDWNLIIGYLELFLEIGIYALFAYVIIKFTIKSVEGDPKGYYGFLANLFQTPDSIIIWKWLKENTSDTNCRRYKSIKEIAEACSLTYGQVRRGCFYHPKIFRLNDKSMEMWTIYPDGS